MRRSRARTGAGFGSLPNGWVMAIGLCEIALHLRAQVAGCSENQPRQQEARPAETRCTSSQRVAEPGRLPRRRRRQERHQRQPAVERPGRDGARVVERQHGLLLVADHRRQRRLARRNAGEGQQLVPVGQADRRSRSRRRSPAAARVANGVPSTTTAPLPRRLPAGTRAAASRKARFSTIITPEAGAGVARLLDHRGAGQLAVDRPDGRQLAVARDHAVDGELRPIRRPPVLVRQQVLEGVRVGVEIERRRRSPAGGPPPPPWTRWRWSRACSACSRRGCIVAAARLQLLAADVPLRPDARAGTTPAPPMPRPARTSSSAQAAVAPRYSSYEP